MRLPIVLLCSLAASSLAACGSVPTPEIEILAIDDNLADVQCAVFLNREPYRVNGEYALTPVKIPIDFFKDASGNPSVEIRVRAVAVEQGADGKKRIKGLAQGEESPCLDDTRTVYRADPRRVQFVLTRNPKY